MARPAPARMPVSRCGAKTSVATNVAIAAMPSWRCASQACLIALKLTRFDDRHHDDGGQHRLRQMVEQRRQKQQRHQHEHAR